MPRKPRLHIDGAFYHVILRGNHRRGIFSTAADRVRFIDLVAEVTDRFGMRVHAYCLMTNHVHLAIQVADVPLGPAMMRIGSRYARDMQKSLSTTGHFFERRYRALLVDADEYLLALVRYIHLNPVRAHLVTDPADYLWSGHRAYLGRQIVPWLTTDFTLSMLAAETNAARIAYRQFVLDAIGKHDDETFMRGANEELRVLRSNSFLARLPTTLNARSHLSLEALIARVCAAHHTNPAQLITVDRSRALAKLRVVVLHHALKLRISSLSAVARRFNRSASTLSETLDHYRRTEPSLFNHPLDLE
jgi:putative transposase